MIISGKQVNKKCYGRVINYRLSLLGWQTRQRGQTHSPALCLWQGSVPLSRCKQCKLNRYVSFIMQVIKQKKLIRKRNDGGGHGLFAQLLTTAQIPKGRRRHNACCRIDNCPERSEGLSPVPCLRPINRKDKCGQLRSNWLLAMSKVVTGVWGFPQSSLRVKL